MCYFVRIGIAALREGLVRAGKLHPLGVANCMYTAAMVFAFPADSLRASRKTSTITLENGGDSMEALGVNARKVTKESFASSRRPSDARFAAR